jgi:hypothetical protein
LVGLVDHTGARGVHCDALELLGQYEKEQRRSAAEADAHVGLRSLCVRAVHPKPKGMHGLLAPFRQLRSLSLHVFIKPDDLRCLRGTQHSTRRFDVAIATTNLTRACCQAWPN